VGRRNPSRVFGGRIMAAEMKADSAKKEAAEKLREAAAETCHAWNYRMIGLGGPAQPSPTIADAIAGRFCYLEVKCSRCSTHSIVDLTAVNKVRRRPETPIWRLEASLRCRHYARGDTSAAGLRRNAHNRRIPKASPEAVNERRQVDSPTITAKCHQILRQFPAAADPLKSLELRVRSVSSMVRAGRS
jgi:hypothetical protein